MSTQGASARWAALGTTTVLLVDRPTALSEARARVEHELAAIDRACSRFRPDSELTRVNRAAGRPVSVSPLFLQTLEAALMAYVQTDGAVDPTVGQALRLAGYDRDLSLVAAGAGAARRGVRVRLARAPGATSIRLNRELGTVSVARGVHLDLGASAKALAADRAADAAHRATESSVLVSLGGDIALSGVAPQGGWRVRVCDDHAAGPRAPGQIVSLTDGGLATSSTTVRRWYDGETERHHIIDPARGESAEEVWRTVSVAAASCVQANTAATAAIVLGRSAPEWLGTRLLPARLVQPDGRVLRVGGWPHDELDVVDARGVCPPQDPPWGVAP